VVKGAVREIFWGSKLQAGFHPPKEKCMVKLGFYYPRKKETAKGRWGQGGEEGEGALRGREGGFENKGFLRQTDCGYRNEVKLFECVDCVGCFEKMQNRQQNKNSSGNVFMQ